MDGQVPPNDEKLGSNAIAHDDDHHSYLDPMRPSLGQLPTELVLEIIKYLSVESQAALAFTNKRLKHVIGIDPWGKLKTREHSSARKYFIRRLERDLPDWKFCSSCELLHPAQLIPSLWEQVKSKNCVVVGASRSLPHFRIYRDHLNEAFQRQIRGKPDGCCLEIFKQTFPPVLPKAKPAEAVFKDITTTIEVDTRLHDVRTHVCSFHEASTLCYISWGATFSLKFSKHKNNEEVLKLVDILQTDGFRICKHMIWGVPKEHGIDCAGINNFVWGRFAQPECHKDITVFYCPLCETTFDITFIHCPVPRSDLIKEIRIKVNKTWTLSEKNWPLVSDSTEILAGMESFEESLLPCSAQYEFPPTSFDLPANKQQPGQFKRRSWKDRIKLMACW